MSEAYDLQSNIKGKPGSQGTLFQVKDKSLLNPAQRWPRGYTPERQAEVRAVTDRIPFTTANDHDKVDVPEQRARVTDVVARSTIPASRLGLLREVNDTPLQGTLGTYYPQSKRLHVDMVNGKSGPQGERDQTLVHELGHHHANSTAQGGDAIRAAVSEHGEKAARQFQPEHYGPHEPLTGTARAKGGAHVSAGVHEAYADNFMQQHYRTRGRDPQPVSQGRYEENFTVAERSRRFPGYNEMRPPSASLSPRQFRDTPFPGMSAARIMRASQ